jgi:hypothetical protein
MVGRVRSTHPLRMQPPLYDASNSTSYCIHITACRRTRPEVRQRQAGKDP